MERVGCPVTTSREAAADIWSAVASVARHRFGYLPINDPKRRRRPDKVETLPAHSKFIAPLQGAESFSIAIQGWRDLGSLTPGYSLQPLSGCGRRCTNQLEPGRIQIRERSKFIGSVIDVNKS